MSQNDCTVENRFFSDIIQGQYKNVKQLYKNC